MANSTLLMDDLRAQVAAGQVLVVVGAGVSIGASGGALAASWTGLLRSGVERCKQAVQPPPSAKWCEIAGTEIDSGEPELLVSAAEKVETKLGGKQGPEFSAWLRDTVGALALRDRSVIDAIGALRAPIATTNYDGLLSDALGQPAVTARNPSDAEHILRGRSSGILHLHGCWRDPDTVVLGIRSYEHHLANPHAQAILRAMMMVKTLLFVGFGAGLDDPNFRALTRWAGATLRDSAYRRFRLVKDDEIAKATAARGDDERLFVLGYGATHGDLAPFLPSLAPARPPANNNVRTVDDTRNHVEPLTTLIATVQDTRVPLSQSLAQALALALCMGNSELAEFCHGEIGGWSMVEADQDVNNSRFAYRRVSAHVSVDQINLEYFALRGGERALFDYFETNRTEFPPLNFLVDRSVAWLEEQAQSVQSPMSVFVVCFSAKKLVRDTTLGQVYAYARSRSCADLLSAIRGELTRRLLVFVQTLSGSGPSCVLSSIPPRRLDRERTY